MAVKAEIDFQKELFEAANKMRGSVAPADYKHYVLPLIFCAIFRINMNRAAMSWSKFLRKMKKCSKVSFQILINIEIKMCLSSRRKQAGTI